MDEVLSQLCFLKPMLKFSVQTFYQPLFSIFPSTILFPQQFFPLIILFPSKSFSHKRPKVKSYSQYSKAKGPPKQKAQAKQKVQKPKVKLQKAKALLPPSGVFYSSKQGGAMGRGVTL
jgi:hypothetical protein